MAPQICLGLLVDRSIAGTRAERITERDEGNGLLARQTPLYLEIDRWADIRRAWFVILFDRSTKIWKHGGPRRATEEEEEKERT